MRQEPSELRYECLAVSTVHDTVVGRYIHHDTVVGRYIHHDTVVGRYIHHDTVVGRYIHHDTVVGRYIHHVWIEVAVGMVVCSICIP